VVIDEGMEDAACKALANEKTTTGFTFTTNTTTMPMPPLISQEGVNHALDNVQKCVVGILERWNESKEIFKVWFPWIEFSRNADRRSMFYGYTFKKETIDDLRPELKEILLTANSCDMQLHKKMLLLFEAELSIINNAAFL
jgi:hypothetical protein